ncbi:MAG: hypothetical protein A3F09_06085 [Chlamydiae bacterium RIFCSPHIGHO2_12_FULL_49_11]|nr:MAG: hypothetical protein A3F09_06085 [Chlamydiae bacterium RIFCSPHIGHO2_12_FULL_49_11]
MRLERDFFSRDTILVAKSLIGAVLVYGTSEAEVIETEAYLGPEDLASHARFKSRKRNHLMFGEPGRLYIYFTYGMYHMLNVVAKESGSAGAVLIRALRPISGIEGKTDGPGKLTKTLKITQIHNGLDAVEGPLFFEDRGLYPPLMEGLRIGIDYAGIFRDKPWRFIKK